MIVNWAQPIERMSVRELEAAQNELRNDLSEGVDYPKLRERVAQELRNR
jgi:hypothetical protein